MEYCIYCNSDKITCLKIHIIRPSGAKRMKCLTCLKTYTTVPTSNTTINKSTNQTQQSQMLN